MLCHCLLNTTQGCCDIYYYLIYQMKAKAHLNSPNVKSKQVYMDNCACPRSFLCTLWYFKKNTNNAFHPCDILYVVVGNGGYMMYIWGEGYGSYCGSSIYLFHIYLYHCIPSYNCLILWTQLIFDSMVLYFSNWSNVILKQAVFSLALNSQLSIFVKCWLSIYLLLSCVACNLTYSVLSLWICIIYPNR